MGICVFSVLWRWVSADGYTQIVRDIRVLRVCSAVCPIDVWLGF